MPMHLARAVECPSVILYGAENGLSSRGIHATSTSSVTSSVHLAGATTVAIEACMSMIAEDSVIAAVRAMLDRPRNPLTIDRAFI